MFRFIQVSKLISLKRTAPILKRMPTIQKGNPEVILVWPNGRIPHIPSPSNGYSIRSLPIEQDHWWIKIQQAAVPRYQPADLRQWLTRYRRLAVPDGILVAIHNQTGTPVATAGSLHSPRTELFANGGEIGWVATVPTHRNLGLATWLCALATKRLLTDTVKTIFLTTGADMPAAITIYLKLGYLPYLYEPSQAQRWEKICSAIGHTFSPEQWFTTADFDD